MIVLHAMVLDVKQPIATNVTVLLVWHVIPIIGATMDNVFLLAPQALSKVKHNVFQLAQSTVFNALHLNVKSVPQTTCSIMGNV